MIEECPKCGAPLSSLRSQNVKICVDNYEKHQFDNKLKPSQKPLIQATR